MAQDKDLFSLHVNLLMNQENISENEARMKAWSYGPEDYVERINADVAAQEKAEHDE